VFGVWQIASHNVRDIHLMIDENIPLAHLSLYQF
jgi:hypothetical protein